MKKNCGEKAVATGDFCIFTITLFGELIEPMLRLQPYYANYVLQAQTHLLVIIMMPSVLR